MSYAFVQQADGVVSGSGTTVATTAGTNFTVALTAGNLKSFYCFYTAAAAKTITFSDVAGNNNASHIQVGNFFNATDSQGAVWGYVKNILGGTGTTTATANAAVTFFSLYCKEISGLDVNNPLMATVAAGNRQAAPGTGTDLVVSGLMTPTNQPGMVDAFGNDFTASAGIPNAGTGFSSRTGVWNVGGLSSRPEDKRITSLANVQATFTALNAGDTYYTMAMLFAEPIVISSGPPLMGNQLYVMP